MVKRLLEHSTVQQFRYFKVLIQEFHIKVDIVFINAIMAFFEANVANDAEEVRFYIEIIVLFISTIVIYQKVFDFCAVERIIPYGHEIGT